MTSGVMMRTTMLNVTGMEVHVVIILELDGIIIVQLVNVLIPMLVLQLVKTNGRPKKCIKKKNKNKCNKKKVKANC